MHEDSRDITTFITHEGLFGYKRLSFAPEKHQHVIRQVIAGTEGVVNVADNLIVPGKTVLPWSQRFFLIFLRERDQEQAAKATRRVRKTSGYLGLGR